MFWVGHFFCPFHFNLSSSPHPQPVMADGCRSLSLVDRGLLLLKGSFSFALLLGIKYLEVKKFASLMNLSSCYDVLIVMSEFVRNNMKALIHPASFKDSGCGWWCNGIGDIFFRHTLDPWHKMGIIWTPQLISVCPVHLSSHGCFHQDNVLQQKDQIISN